MSLSAADRTPPVLPYRNLAELLRLQAGRLAPRPALRYRRDGVYRDLTWDEYLADVLAGAAALVDAGIAVGDRVGLLSENRVEWLVCDLAILTAGGVNVSPHAPLTARQVHFQLEDAGVRWLIVSDRTQLDKALQIRGELPELRGIVAFDSALATEGIPSWAGFLQRGRRLLPQLQGELVRRERALGHDALATILYTSGTTGNPKGVMLTHGTLLHNTAATLRLARHDPDDIVLTWLPFTHIYARTVDHYAGIMSGVLTCLAESPETVVRDLEEVQPTHMSSVPRLYEKVLAACASPDPQRLRRNLRKVFGPRVKWLSSGGAPLPLPVAQAYLEAGILVLQGYGLTESSPVISFNSPDAYKLDTVGRPLQGVDVRIAPDGEVLSRGPHIMKGYWKNPQATAEAIRDGWLHTGDLGELDADGFLKITGRKKELLVLSNGKKVVPAFLEGLLQADPCIEQAVVCGEGRSYLTALIVPNWDNVARALDGQAGPLDPETSVASPAVRGLLQSRVRAALVDVSPAEQVRKFVVLPRPFSVAEEEMTVSLKLRRGVVLKRYAGQLEALYRGEEADATDSPG
jgi:long-chain acyl-CoA synthetase